jgi:hypothetical protein
MKSVKDRHRAAHSLEQLLAQCDPEAQQPEELKAWHEMRDVGREVVEQFNDKSNGEASQSCLPSKRAPFSK